MGGADLQFNLQHKNLWVQYCLVSSRCRRATRCGCDRDRLSQPRAGAGGTGGDSWYLRGQRVFLRCVVSQRACDCELSSPRRLRPEVCGYESPHVSFLLFNCYNLSSSYPWAGARLGLPLPRWISFGFDAMQKNPKIQNPNYVVPCTWIPRMGNFGWWSDFLAPSGTSLVNKATWDPSQKTHSLGDFCRAGKEIAPRRGTAGLIAVLIAGGGLGWC